MKRKFLVTVEVEASNSLGVFSEQHFLMVAEKIRAAVDELDGVGPAAPVHCAKVELPSLLSVDGAPMTVEWKEHGK